MCGFCTLWMCEAYVILWVGIWWVLLWSGSFELVIIVLRDFVYFVMCRVVYVWVLYCMDVRGLCNNVSVYMVGNSIP